jgi:hypothetical protein
MCMAESPSPAVDRDHRAGLVIGPVGRQELNDFGAILDRPELPKRDQLGSIPIALDATGNDRRYDPSGRDHARDDAVHRDPEAPEIVREIPRVVGDSGFRCPVMRVAAIGGTVRSLRPS